MSASCQSKQISQTPIVCGWATTAMETPQAKRTLLQKYDIPINHLDFEYLRNCSNAKEVERIFSILKSGQEGYFPDLTQFAEDRLKTLNPNSKVLRVEVPLLTRVGMDKAEWQDMSSTVSSWETQIKEKHKSLRELAAAEANLLVPPVRQSGFVESVTDNSSISEKKPERIKACDYQQWDKYDPDTEILKMDLTEERVREKVAAKNKRNAQKPLIELLDEPSYLTVLSAVEREELANQHRIKGNDHFKAHDYREAIDEYTQSITAQRTAVGLNNRALAYLKLGEHKKTIIDCDECLKLDCVNVKALMRKGQALMNTNQFTEAFGVYSKIIELDAGNADAKSKLMELRRRLPNLPPASAVRMKIQASSSEDAPQLENINSNVSSALQKTHKNEYADYDPSELIIPKKIVPSRLAKMSSAMGNVAKPMKKDAKTANDGKSVQQESEVKRKPMMMRNETPKIVMSKKNMTTYDNGVVIEEL